MPCLSRQSLALLLCANGLMPVLAGDVRSAIYRDECRLQTQQPELQQFHALLHYPHEHGLRGDGLVVGIEKSDADQVMRGARLQVVRDAPPGVQPRALTASWLKELLQQGRKAMFVSHALAYAQGQPESIYDAYAAVLGEASQTLPSDLLGLPWLDCERRPVAREDAYGASWQALQAVRQRLQRDLAVGRHTQLLVIVMGWNTNQIEAMQNFNALLRILKATAPAGFSPYVLGVSWPSQWDSDWALPLVRAASLINKGNDADEIGAGWLGALLQTVALPEARRRDLPVWAIGHSFGARALSHALCRGTVLVAPGGEPPDVVPTADWLINLQAAYSFNRFSADGAGSVQLAYADGCPGVRRLLFTASRHDEAAGLAGRLAPAPWVGTARVWQLARETQGRWDRGLPDLQLSQARADGSVVGLRVEAGRFHYVEASELIRYRAYGTGGGAHSDIYREPMGRFLWNFLGEAENAASDQRRAGR